jgi:hypothetical protein
MFKIGWWRNHFYGREFKTILGGIMLEALGSLHVYVEPEAK